MDHTLSQENNILEIFPEKEHPEAVEFCKLFLSNTNQPRYILGCNEISQALSKILSFDGFIDDFTPKNSFQNKPIIKLNQLPKNSLVISTSSLRPISASRNLANNDIIHLDHFSFLKYSKISLEINQLTPFKEDLLKHQNKYEQIYQKLTDSLSKKTFLNILNFRYSSDIYYLKDFTYSVENQYFEDFLNLQSNEVFIDAGGFEGETSLELIKYTPDYKSIYIFEPDPINLLTARKNLAKYSNVSFYPLGLFKSKKTLFFESGDGSSSKISQRGNIRIDVDTLDNIISEKITFIKMDIEGAEIPAIYGAQNHIEKDHPKLAICCYHKPNDFWKIPEIILSIRDDYQIYLRHYTEGIDETVMFFIPKK